MASTASAHLRSERLCVPCWTIRLYLPGGLDGDAALVDVVAARLLDVDVLAGLAGPDRHQRVPVVGRGDRDGVDRLVLQHAADVLLGGRRMTVGLAGLARDRLDLLEPFGVGPRVGVDQADDLDAGHRGELAHMGAASPVEPGHGDADGVIGADDPARRLGPADREGRPDPGGGHRSAQEGAAIQACSRHRSGSSTGWVTLDRLGANPQTKVEQCAIMRDRGRRSQRVPGRSAGPSPRSAVPACTGRAPSCIGDTVICRCEWSRPASRRCGTAWRAGPRRCRGCRPGCRPRRSARPPARRPVGPDLDRVAVPRACAWAGTNFWSEPAIANPRASATSNVRSPPPTWSKVRTILLPCVPSTCRSGSGRRSGCRSRGPGPSAASRMATSCLFLGWMSLPSPMSMITACPVFGRRSMVIVCASRSSAQALSRGLGRLGHEVGELDPVEREVALSPLVAPALDHQREQVAVLVGPAGVGLALVPDDARGCRSRSSA